MLSQLGVDEGGVVAIFDSFIEFGNAVMDGASRNERPSVRYKRLLGLIGELLRDTHSLVVEKLEAIEAATSWSSAQDLARELRDDPLSEAFRAQGLCDAFQGLGNALLSLNDYTVCTDAHAFSRDQTRTAAEVAEMLADREVEVARRYVLEIQELADVVYDTSGDLELLHEKAARARAVLTTQMADFDSQARTFTTLVPL